MARFVRALARGPRRPQRRARLAAQLVPEISGHRHGADRSADREQRATRRGNHRAGGSMDREPAENARQLGLFGEPPDAAPGALRRVVLGSCIVEYRFERRRRRTIGIRIDANGVTVSAPPRAPWREIERFLRSSERWILSKLDEWAAAGRPVRLLGATGETLPLFGRNITLEVHQGTRAVTMQGERLAIRHPEPARHDRVRELLVR